jgi:hypothetical protein
MGMAKLKLGITKMESGGLFGVLDAGFPLAVAGSSVLDLGSSTPSRVPGFELPALAAALVCALGFRRRL